MFDVALRSYFRNPASKHKLTNPDNVREVVRVLSFSKAPDQNGIPNMALKQLPQQALSLFAHIFNAVLGTHHFP